MAEITALFWDVGGVMLTNGWDREGRHRAAERFRLDRENFQSRREMLSADFEAGRLTLDEYLDRSIFYQPRSFPKDEFKAFLFAQSQPRPDTLAFVEQVAGSGSAGWLR